MSEGFFVLRKKLQIWGRLLWDSVFQDWIFHPNMISPVSMKSMANSIQISSKLWIKAFFKYQFIRQFVATFFLPSKVQQKQTCLFSATKLEDQRSTKKRVVFFPWCKNYQDHLFWVEWWWIITVSCPKSPKPIASIYGISYVPKCSVDIGINKTYKQIYQTWIMARESLRNAGGLDRVASHDVSAHRLSNIALASGCTP